MIQAASAITYIQAELNKLKANGQIFGKITRSKTTLSLYLDTKKPSPDPQKTERVSNHHPDMRHMVQGNRKPWNTTNISIEFYEPVRLPNGKVKRNRLYTNVLQNAKGTRKPFDVTIYEYKAAQLDYTDIPIIFQSLISFITNNKFQDPLKGTPKEAKEITRTATIIQRKPKTVSAKTSSSMSVTQPPTYTQTSTQQNTFSPPTITESTLRRIIRESLIEYLYN